MNWTLIIQYALSGAIVSWPVFIAGAWLNRKHVSRVTEAQTEKIAEITDDQTRKLQARDQQASHQQGHSPARHQPPPGGYHGHGDVHS